MWSMTCYGAFNKNVLWLVGWSHLKKLEIDFIETLAIEVNSDIEWYRIEYWIDIELIEYWI